ncbi:MAG: hypothetical protein HYU68_15375 [Bacteroidetes bacterium]|nr:hypothetical protein [Bacteroidota bacterium]
MKNFTQQIKTAILLSALVLLAITVKAQSGNYFVKHDGTVVKMYGEKASFDGWIYYTDENWKETKIYQDEVKLLVFGKAVYISKNKKSSLVRVIAYNDNYFIAEYSLSDGIYHYLYDRDFNRINKGVVALFAVKSKSGIKLKKKQYDENFAIYFKDCNELNETCHKNMDEGRAAFEDIDYYNCGSSTDLITNKPIEKNAAKSQVVQKKEIHPFFVDTKGVKKEFEGYHLITLNENFKYSKGYTIYETQSKPASEIKYAYFDNKICAPIKVDDKDYMVEIICFNNDYVLFGKYKTSQRTLEIKRNAFGIYDRKTNSIIDEMPTENTDVSIFLKKYFDGCKIEKSLGITYYNCNNSKEFIEGIKFE